MAKDTKKQPARESGVDNRDPLEIQISVQMDLPKGTRPTHELAMEFVEYRIEHGEDHPRAKTWIVRWKNPARPGKGASWRQGNQADAFATLGKWLVNTDPGTITVRHSEKARKPKPRATGLRSRSRTTA